MLRVMQVVEKMSPVVYRLCEPGIYGTYTRTPEAYDEAVVTVAPAGDGLWASLFDLEPGALVLVAPIQGQLSFMETIFRPEESYSLIIVGRLAPMSYRPIKSYDDLVSD